MTKYIIKCDRFTDIYEKSLPFKIKIEILSKVNVIVHLYSLKNPERLGELSERIKTKTKRRSI